MIQEIQYCFYDVLLDLLSFLIDEIYGGRLDLWYENDDLRYEGWRSTVWKLTIYDVNVDDLLYEGWRSMMWRLTIYSIKIHDLRCEDWLSTVWRLTIYDMKIDVSSADVGRIFCVVFKFEGWPAFHDLLTVGCSKKKSAAEHGGGRTNP